MDGWRLGVREERREGREREGFVIVVGKKGMEFPGVLIEKRRADEDVICNPNPRS